jgi:peptidoglycan/LPS O-acetylase OafA/YrhL
MGNLCLFLEVISITLVLSVLIATITLHLVENPGIALGKKLLLRINASRQRQRVTGVKMLLG